MNTKYMLKAQRVSRYSKEAEDCLKIWKFLADLDNGHVWQQKWDVLVKHCYSRDKVHFFKPTKIGEIFLKGLEA